MFIRLCKEDSLNVFFLLCNVSLELFDYFGVTVDYSANEAVTASDCCGFATLFFFNYEHCIPCATVDANAHMLHVLHDYVVREAGW